LFVPIAGGSGNNNQDKQNNSSTGAIVGSTLGLLALAGVLFVALLLKRRKNPLEDIEEIGELSEDGLGDSSTMASDDLFVSEYGFSDRHNSDAEQEGKEAKESGDDMDDDIFASDNANIEAEAEGGDGAKGGESGGGHNSDSLGQDWEE
jgi:hypothetical protein